MAAAAAASTKRNKSNSNSNSNSNSKSKSKTRKRYLLRTMTTCQKLEVQHVTNLLRDYTLTDTGKGTSSSNSVIALGTHTSSGLPIAMKLYLGGLHYNEDFDKQEYESTVYQHVANLNLCNTVRLVGRLQSLPLTALQRSSSSKKKNWSAVVSQLWTKAKAVKNKNVNVRVRVYGIVTEFIPTTVTLERRLSSSSSVGIVKPLVFQIIFTLAALQEAGVQHNDLHLDNILVNVKPPQPVLTYTTRAGGGGGGGPYTFHVPIQHSGQVLLFDWDLGYCQPCGHNPFLDQERFCSHYGVCNALNSKFDVYTCLRYLQQLVRDDTEFTAFVRSAIGAVPQHETFFGRMCNNIAADTQKKTVCAPYPPSQPTTVMTLAELILHPYFRSFRS